MPFELSVARIGWVIHVIRLNSFDMLHLKVSFGIDIVFYVVNWAKKKRKSFKHSKVILAQPKCQKLLINHWFDARTTYNKIRQIQFTKKNLVPRAIWMPWLNKS